MAKVRRLKKNSQKNHMNQFMELKRCLEEQQIMLEKMSEQMASQQKVMQLFYKEYQALTKSLDIQHLNNYIRFRDSMIKDMRQYEERNQTNTRGYALLDIYVGELTELLEDHNVEIIEAIPGTEFDPHIEKALTRVDTFFKEEHNRVCKVYDCGYRRNGIRSKKINVDVCICR